MRDPGELAAEAEAFRRARRSVFYPKTDVPDLVAVLRAARGAEADEPRQVAAACQTTLGGTAVTAEPLADQGTFHRLYRLTRSGSPPLIARVSALGAFGRDFPMVTSRRASDALRAAGLPVPQTLAVDLSRRLAPFDFEIQEEARGTPLRNLFDDEDRVLPALRELGRVLARVHATPARGFGWLDPDPDPAGGLRGLFASWPEYVLLNLAGHVAVCREIGAIDDDLAGRIGRAFAGSGPLLSGAESALLHGDLGGHNVFTDGPEITALIDWEDCLAGDPAFDVAFWATFHPPDRHGAFLEGYQSVRRPAADFEPRFWLYFLRIALSKTVHRHRFGYADRPGGPPASSRIRLGLERFEALRPPR